jgi:hypothetical protein
MSTRTVHRIKSTLLSLLALGLVFPSGAFAEEYLNQGIKMFNQKQYAASRPYFDKAAENAPWDSNAFYYQALAAQYCRDWPAAKRLWAKVIEKFPGTPAASNATAAMKALDPNYFKRSTAGEATASRSSGGGGSTASSGSSSSSSSSDDDSNAETLIAAVQYQAPAQSRIPVSRSDVRVMLDAQINNRGVKVEFNGSSSILTPKDAKALAVTMPDRSAVKVGKRVPVTIRIGDVVANSFPIMVEEADRSRIGDDFFRKFSYQLDPNFLVVTKKITSGSSKTAYDVPFRKSGSDMYVEVTINGRHVSMLFDPKGGETVVPAKRAREFGLDVESTEKMELYDAQKQSGPMRGDAGFGEVKVQTTAEAKVNIGPVANQVISVKVDDKVRDAKIGTDAFGGWKFSVDPGASLIRFSR